MRKFIENQHLASQFPKCVKMGIFGLLRFLKLISQKFWFWVTQKYSHCSINNFFRQNNSKPKKGFFCQIGPTLKVWRRNYIAEALLKGGNFHRDKIFARQLFLGCMANWWFFMSTLLYHNRKGDTVNLTKKD